MNAFKFQPTMAERKPSDASIKSGNSFVGFANFPNQVFRRCIKNGFDFTIMVVGQSGLGKSTFINSLFLAEIYDTKQPKLTTAPATVKIDEKTICLVENDVKLYMTFVDTPGFGDAVNNANCWKPIIKHVDSKFADYLAEETKIERSAIIKDHRVHLCLYFIAPTGHGLKELDIEFMKALQDRVNIVPVIAKADTLTKDELLNFKKNILQALEENKISVYKFPEQENVENKPAVARVEDNRRRIPFAIVGSNKISEVGNRKVRVREYPWGVVEVENLAHNDFIALRDMIIRSNLVDLINVTRDVHYENYRFQQMRKGIKDVDNDPFTQFEKEKLEMEQNAKVMRETKEKIFYEKATDREKKLQERSRFIEEQDKENRLKLEEKRRDLDRLVEECNKLRGVTDSSSSIGRTSPPEKNKKKSSTLNIFNRN